MLKWWADDKKTMKNIFNMLSESTKTCHFVQKVQNLTKKTTKTFHNFEKHGNEYVNF